MLNLLATVRAELGSLSQVARVVKVVVFVNSAPGLAEQHLVANGASDLLVRTFGDAIGRPARSAVGVAALPLGFGCLNSCCPAARGCARSQKYTASSNTSSAVTTHSPDGIAAA